MYRSDLKRLAFTGYALFSLSIALMVVVYFLDGQAHQYDKSWPDTSCHAFFGCPPPPQKYWYIRPLGFLGVSSCLASLGFFVTGMMLRKKKPLEKRQDDTKADRRPDYIQ